MMDRCVDNNCLNCLKSKNKVCDNLPKPREAREISNLIDSEPPVENILIVKNIDPCISENGPLHNTDKFYLMRRKIDPQLVVRRGENFKIILELSRPFDYEKDAISFIFTESDEEKTSYGQRTLIAIPLLSKPDRNFLWNATIESQNDLLLTVIIKTNPHAVIGRWKLDVDTKIFDGGAYCYCWETTIYLLFNPWCKKDPVYLPSDDWKRECVLNDTGIIWRGTYNRLKPVVWKYDQFENVVLDCAMYILHQVGRVKGLKKSDPVAVTRGLAAAVNSEDDDGVVKGNWSDDFTNGTAPTKWIGSREILRLYYKNKKEVKYGQCWVFAGVLTTICRTLGIPSRPVTNYSSAHDTEGSLTVDYFTNENGDVLEDLNTDSVWTFHVWTEVWMERKDLDEKWNGWQVVDATPQEKSDEVYRVGPASVAAVKHGEILKPYDCSFVYAEVNADKVFWKYSGPHEPLKLLGRDTKDIGKIICTKSPGEFEGLNITNIYKHPERTPRERYTMQKALRLSQNKYARYYLNKEFHDVHFEFALKDDIKIGQSFNANVAISNGSDTNYAIAALIRVDVVDYRGGVGATVAKRNFDVDVAAGSEEEIGLEVTYEQYAKKLIDQGAFKIKCYASVKGSDYEFYGEEDYRARLPDVNILVDEPVVLYKNVEVELSVENSLPVPLRRGEFFVDAPGFRKPLKIKIKYAVLPGKKAMARFKFTPERLGECSIAAKFVCKEMTDCDGFKIVAVLPSNEVFY